MTGSLAIARSLGLDMASAHYDGIAWDAPYLTFAVREPFPSVITQATLVTGQANERSPLTLRSLMPEHGVIFSDGIENDFLQFNSGTQATIGIADRQGQLVV